MFILDTTATEGPRTHEMMVDGIVKPFTFQRATPLPLPSAVALKFLKHEGFLLTDENGQVLPFRRRPRQPDELGAGEKITLADNETIARYDELSSAALLHRAIELPGGEKFAQGENKPDRAEMISFITTAAAARKKANAAKESDVGEGEYTPEAEAEEDEAA
jgi:hypothetical protein